jgi:sec-independent protein translocase protein TatA
MFGIGTGEMMVFAIIAVILFGGRLPSVARSLGKSIVEFKKGMHDLEQDVKSQVYSEPTARVSYNEQNEPSSPRFEPPKA